MSAPRWLTEERRKTCMACSHKADCKQAFCGYFSNVSACPIGAHPTLKDRLAELEAKHEKAFPPGVDPISGCCDRMD